MCRYAEPEHHIEDEVRDGELSGSMYGVVESDDKAKKDRSKSSQLDSALQLIRCTPPLARVSRSAAPSVQHVPAACRLGFLRLVLE